VLDFGNLLEIQIYSSHFPDLESSGIGPLS